jgi:hypothetical protein
VLTAPATALPKPDWRDRRRLTNPVSSVETCAHTEQNFGTGVPDAMP